MTNLFPHISPIFLLMPGPTDAVYIFYIFITFILNYKNTKKYYKIGVNESTYYFINLMAKQITCGHL